jgi:LCP family protein required for cell wall assembly
MGQLEQIIAQNFGIQTNYYGIIDYTTFRDAVNSVGGVTVTIQSQDPRGLYDPYTNLNLPNGPVALNGQQALNLARARGDGPGSYGFPQGDFNRTQHQQQLLIALKQKVSSASVLVNPLRVAHLADAVGNNVKTNASLGVMETLYRDTKGAAGPAIQTVTLNNYHGQDLLRSYFTSDGEDALVPAAGLNDYSQIQSAIQDLFSN